MGQSTSEARAWGREAVDRKHVEAFARAIPASPSEHATIVQTLHEFPLDVLVRGMFFDGLVKSLRASCGAPAVAEIALAARIPASTLAFALYPHRDFYKLFFAAAPRLHPGVPLPSAMQTIAETFYPVFRESMIGRTIALLMSDEPWGVLQRLTEAYNLCVQGNTHSVVRAGATEARWTAIVEPTTIYPQLFTGIVDGTMRTQGAPKVKIDVVDQRREGERTRWTFRIRW